VTQSSVQYPLRTFSESFTPADSVSQASARQKESQSLLQLSWAVLTGWSIRLVVMAFVYRGFLDPARDHWEFGYEIGHVARSIVMGHGFSNPYWSDTGPTALLTPVYPCLMAGIFAVFGVFTKLSALVMLMINCFFSAVTAVPIFVIARKTFDLQTAKLAAWLWAFFPYAINISATTMWYHSFVALLLAILFLLALFLQSHDGLAAWAGFGVLFGFAALTNPVILAIAPFLGAWLWIRLAKQRKRFVAASATGLLAMIITILPWPMRNVLVLHQNVMFKDGFWLEVCVGNVNESLHWWDAGQHPSGSAFEKAEFEKIGESNYMAAKRRKALDYIETRPGRYAWRSLRHVMFMWTGFWSLDRVYLQQEPLDPENILMATMLSTLALLGLQRAFRYGNPPRGAMLYLLVLVSFPIPYYLSHLDPGFRHPVDPLLVVLACPTILKWIRRSRVYIKTKEEAKQFAYQ
jgi:4-amino-4-deoxy-L-arabinose transferase-like glycosyltransferase